VVGAIGCASSPEPRRSPGPAMEGSTETSGGTPAALPMPAPPPMACEARIGADRLRRSSVRRTVDAGLGRWLQTVSVDPLVARGRFKGWIIRSLNPGTPNDRCYAGVDLRAGDVVTRVNGRGVERPEEALEVWTALPASAELVIDFVRDGQPRTMRFGIVDQ
jgi:hypothetical protein